MKPETSRKNAVQTRILAFCGRRHR